jgi:hypothetical protein
MLGQISGVACNRGSFAEVGLCCIGQATSDDEKTALPTFAAWVGDFDGMQQERQIRLIVPYSKTIFFIDKGDQLGTAAEWGSESEDWLNKGTKSQLVKCPFYRLRSPKRFTRPRPKPDVSPHPTLQ